MSILTHPWEAPMKKFSGFTEARFSLKKVFLKISQNSHENACARVSFLIKLQASSLQLYQKRDSDTGVSLGILQNFKEHLFFSEHLWWLLLALNFYFVNLQRTYFIFLMCFPRLDMISDRVEIVSVMSDWLFHKICQNRMKGSAIMWVSASIYLPLSDKIFSSNPK